jgi:putative ABC transport system substrate-binding protein
VGRLDQLSALARLDQLPALARELVSRRPDVLLGTHYTFIKALKQETTTIPIVMLWTSDPVQNGLVTNLARPEGNVTGVAFFVAEVLAKRIQLLKEIVPQLKRLAFIWRQVPDPELTKLYEDKVTTAASKLGVSWQLFRPVVAKDYDEIFARIAAEHFDAAYIQADSLNNQPENTTRIGQLALRHLIPTTGDTVQMAKAGVLLTYTQDWEHDAPRMLSQVDKLLRGAKPSDLPVEQGTVFQLKINLKTAKALGLTVPPSLLAQVDEVIE